MTDFDTQLHTFFPFYYDVSITYQNNLLIYQRKNKRRQRIDQLRGDVLHTAGTSTTNRQKPMGGVDFIDDYEDEDAIEIRPVRRRDAVEAGLDYWIDESDLKREKMRKMAVKNRKVCIIRG